MSEAHVEVTTELMERYLTLTAEAREKATPLHASDSDEGQRLATMMEMADSYTSDAKWFIEKAQQYAKDRKVFNRPIGQNQGIQFPIARAYSKMCAAELMLREAINLFDQGKNPGKESNLAKLLCSEASWEAAETCMQTFGGFGFAEEYEVERKYREARLYQVAPISTNLILSFIAEHVLNLPRSY